MKTRAVAFPERERSALIEVEVGEPGPGEVLLEATLTMISTGTELVCFRGESDPDTHWAGYAARPHRPGYSAVGRIAALGEGVEGFAVGDRVVAVAKHQALSIVSAERGWLTPIADDLSDEQAAWSVLGVITQTNVRVAEHALGERAVIIGLGPLGQLVTQYLRVLGLAEVLAIDTVPARIAAALDHGATAAFEGDVRAAREFVLEHTGGRLADAVYDVTGHFSVLPLALPLAREFGRLMLLGDSPFPSRQHLTYDVVSRGVRIIGSRSSWLPDAHAWWTPRRQIELLHTYLRRGQMRLDDLITHRFRPEDAATVYPMLMNDRGATIGCVFDWTGG